MPPAARVLQVVISLNPGGTERLVVDLVSRLSREIPMAVCCLDEPGAWAEGLRERGVPVDSLGRQPGFHPGLGARVRALARAHGATVIHAHHYSPFVYSALAKVLMRARLVFTEHGRTSDAPPSSRRRMANRLLRLLPDRVFTVSNELRTHLIAEGFSSDQVAVIYNGIDTQLETSSSRRAIRSALGASDETLVVGTIARLDPVKDLATLLQACAGLAARRPLLLVVVGDGPERHALEQRARDLGIASSVRWLGRRDDARVWLSGCDVYVNSSISEGVSLTILEAMAASLPVIATAAGGTPEVVTEQTGVLVPPRDPAALTRELSALASDPARRTKLGSLARRRVETYFSLDQMVERYRAVYLAPSLPAQGSAN